MSNDKLTDEATAQKADDVLRRMLNTPPRPKRAKPKAKRKAKKKPAK